MTRQEAIAANGLVMALISMQHALEMTGIVVALPEQVMTSAVTLVNGAHFTLGYGLTEADLKDAVKSEAKFTAAMARIRREVTTW